MDDFPFKSELIVDIAKLNIKRRLCIKYNKHHTCSFLHQTHRYTAHLFSLLENL